MAEDSAPHSKSHISRRRAGERRFLIAKVGILTQRVAPLERDSNFKMMALQSKFDDHAMGWMEFYLDTLDNVPEERRLRTFKDKDGTIATLPVEAAMNRSDDSEMSLTRKVKVDLDKKSIAEMNALNGLPDVKNLIQARNDLAVLEAEIAHHYGCSIDEINWDTRVITRDEDDGDDGEMESLL